MADEYYIEGSLSDKQDFGLIGVLSEEVENLSGTLSEPDTMTGTLEGVLLRGFSAYTLACINGYVGSEESWLASLKGDTGERGATGRAGNGIDRAYFNTNGTLSLHYTNGDTYTTDRSIVPLKGVDYFTEKDVEEIVEEVLKRLGGQ